MRYILYARKSSESEDRQVQSIDDQLRELRSLAAHRSLSIVDEMMESKSAKDPGARPIFTQALKKIQDGEAEAILCWSINRLSRNPVDSGTLSWMLQQGALQCIQTIDREYRPEDNVLLMAVESGVANQFILDLKKGVRRGMQSKREKGWSPHQAPEGYLNDRMEKTIVGDPERFPLIRRAWDLMLTSAYTVPQVRQELDGWGYKTRKTRKFGGKPISRTALYDLFGNPFYYGWFASGGKLYKGAHEPMVTRDEFDRVQRILHRAHHAQPQKKEFAFTGLIQCGACGCLITAEERIKRYESTGNLSRRYVYYHCTGARGCSKQSVSEEYIEEQIAAALEQCALSPAIANWIETVLTRDLNEQPSTQDKMEEQRQRALTQARMNLERLFQLRIDQEISKDEFTPRKERLDAEIASLEHSGDEMDQKRIQQRQSLANALEFSTTAYERFTRGGVRRKREVASVMATGYFLTLGKLEIRPHPLLDAIRTFEPLKAGSDKLKEGPLDPQNPDWCYLGDNIRYALETSRAVFPALRE